MEQRQTVGPAGDATPGEEGGHERWHAAALELMPNPVFVIQHGEFVFANPAGLRHHGARDLEELRRQPALAYLHPDDQPTGRLRLDNILKGNPLAHTVERTVRLDGEVRYIESAGVRIDYDGGPAALVVLRDVTDRVNAEQELEAMRARLQDMFDRSPMGIALAEATGEVVDANEALVTLLGRPRHELVGRPATAWLGAAAAEVTGGLARADGPDSFELEVEVVRGDGSSFLASLVATRLADLRQGGLMFQVHDVSARRAYERELAYQARHDRLTGALNRHGFEAALDEATSGAAPVAVLFVDLDRFKAVNDSFGHAVGDGVLRAVAGRLAAAVRPGDSVGRLGGDEFAVLCPGIGDDRAASRLTERVRAALEPPVRLGDVVLGISSSVGACVGRPGVDPLTLLREADTAMYEAKRAGRAAQRPVANGHGS